MASFDFRSPGYITGYYRIKGNTTVTVLERTASAVKLKLSITMDLAGWIHTYSYVRAYSGGTQLGSATMSSPSYKWGKSGDKTGKFVGKRTKTFEKTLTVSATTTSLTIDWKFDCYDYQPTFLTQKITFGSAKSDFNIYGTITAKTDKNTTYVTGPATFHNGSKTLTFNLSNLTYKDTTKWKRTPDNWMYWCKRIDSSGNVKWVTDKLLDSNNKAGTHKETTSAGTVYYYRSTSCKYMKITVEKGYKYQIGVLAYHKGTNTHSNSDGGWDAYSNAVSKQFKINNVNPTLDEAQWTSDKFLIREVNGSTVNVGTSKKNSNTWIKQDMIIPSSGTTVTVAARINNGGTINSATVKFGSYSVSLKNGTNNNECYVRNGWLYGKFWLSGKVSAKSVIKEANFSYKNTYGETASTKLSKWTYVNSPPTINSLVWTANKFVVEGRMGSLKTGGENSSSSYHRNNMTIRNAGDQVTIWAKYSSRDNKVAPIKTREIQDGGANGGTWTKWSSPKSNAEGFWSTRKITSRICNPYAKVVDYLDETSEKYGRTSSNAVMTCSINSRPSFSKLEWTAAGKFTTAADRWNKTSSGYVKDDLFVPSGGASITIRAVLNNKSGASITTRQFFREADLKWAIGSSVRASGNNMTTTFSVNSGWLYPNSRVVFQAPVAYAKDALGDDGWIILNKWIYLNTPPYLSGSEWTADNFLVKNKQTGVISTSISNLWNMTSHNMIIPSSGCNNVIARCRFSANVKIASGSVTIGGQSVSNPGNTSKCWWDGENKFHGNVALKSKGQGGVYNNASFIMTDILGESGTTTLTGNITVNTKPTVSNLVWSSGFYVKDSARGTAIKNTKTNESIITSNNYKTISIEAKVSNSGAPIKSQSLKLGSLSASASISGSKLSGRVNVSSKTTTKFSASVTDCLNETGTTSLDRSVTLNTPPSFSSLQWKTSKYITSAGSTSPVTSGTYTSSYIITATTAISAGFKAKINNGGAYLNTAVFNLKHSSSSGYNHKNVTMTFNNKAASPAEATCNISLNGGSGKIYNGYSLVVKDVLEEGFTKTATNNMILINTKPSNLKAYVATPKFVETGATTVKGQSSFTQKDIITSTLQPYIFIRVTGDKKSGAAMRTFKAVSGSYSATSTLNESSPKSFTVNLPKITVSATQNSSNTFKVTVTDNLGEFNDVICPKVTINTKPSWANGKAIYINDINTKNVVVSKKTTSAKITAKTAKTKVGARLKSFIFSNTAGIKPATDVVVNTENTSASYTFTWPETESKTSKFTCFIRDVLDEDSPPITSSYSLIVNTRPLMKGSVYVKAGDKDDKLVTNNMMTNSQLYIKTTNNGKSITVSWDAPTLYNGATVKNYNFYVSFDNGAYTLKSSSLKSPTTSYTTSFNINDVHRFKFKITCVDSYGDLSSNELEAKYPVYTNVKPYWPSGAAITIGGKNYTHYYAASSASTSSTTVAWTGAADKGAALSYYRIWNTDAKGTSFQSTYKQVTSTTKSNVFKFSSVSSAQGSKYKFKVVAYDALNEASPELTHNFFAIINTKPVLTFTALTADAYVTNRNRNDGSIIVKSNCGKINVGFKCISNNSNGLKSVTITCSDTNLSAKSTITYNKQPGVNFTATASHPMTMKNYSQGKEIRFSISATDGLDSVTVNSCFALYNTLPWFTAKPTIDTANKYGSVGSNIIVKSDTSYINVASSSATNGAPLVKIETRFVRSSGSKTSGSTVTTSLSASNKVMSQSVTHKSNISSITQGEKFYYIVRATDELGEFMDSQNSYIATVNTKPSVPTFELTSDNYLNYAQGIITSSTTKTIYATAAISKTGAPLKQIKLTNKALNGKSGSIGSFTADNINANSYNFSKKAISASGCQQGGEYCYTVLITDVLNETATKDTERVLYNTIPTFDKPLVSTVATSNMIYVSGNKGNIIVKSDIKQINLKCNNVKTSGAALKNIKVEVIEGNSIKETTTFSQCVDKTSYTFNNNFNSSNYGSPGKTILYRVYVYDKLNEFTKQDSYTVLWNTIPTMTNPYASAKEQWKKDDNNYVFKSTTKDVNINAIVSNAGAPLVNTVVTLIKVEATTGSMTSPVTYTMTASEANKYTLNKTQTFKTIPNQGSKWYFSVKSTDKLGESVTKSSNNFIYNTIPSFSATPCLITSDAKNYIFSNGSSGDIIVNSKILEIIVTGCVVNTAGSPLSRIDITPLKLSGSGSCNSKTVNTNALSYDLNSNKQSLKFNTLPASASQWYFTLTATDVLNESKTVSSYKVLWNTPPTLTKPIPYAANASDFMQDYSKNGDIIIKSTLREVILKSSLQSPGAKIVTVKTEHKKVSGTSTQTSTDVKTLNKNSEEYVVKMPLSANQDSVHNYVITITDQLNEVATSTSHNVKVNTVPTITSLLINGKTANHYILSNQKTVVISGTASDKGAMIASYLYVNNATGTNAKPVANILKQTNSASFNETITINNVSNTKHTFTVTVTDDLKESSFLTTAVATVNTKPYYKATDKVYINNNNTTNPFLVAHNIGSVNVSWIAPVNVGAEITNYFYAYTTDGGKTWSSYKDRQRNLNDTFNYTAKQDLSHIFKVYAQDAMGERTDLMYDGTFSEYKSNMLLNNTIPWFVNGSYISLSSSVPCVLTNSVTPLDANKLTNESITIPSTGSSITISWPHANNKGGAMTNYLLYRSAEATDKQNYPNNVTLTVESSKNSVTDAYYKNTVTTAYHYYRLLPTDIFYGSNTQVDYKNYLYSPKIVKNIKPKFESGAIEVVESNSNKILSSEINSITIKFPKMAAKTHGLALKEYQVYISNDNGTKWQKFTTTTNSFTFTNLKLVQNTRYKFKVVIYDGLEYSTELVSDSYLINTIPYFTNEDFVTVDGFKNDFDLDYSRPSVLIQWSPATTLGEAVKGYRIEVLRSNLSNSDKGQYVQEVDTGAPVTSYIFELPYTEKKEFDTLQFRIYAYDYYSDSSTIDSYLQSCKLTIKGAFQIKRHD